MVAAVPLFVVAMLSTMAYLAYSTPPQQAYKTTAPNHGSGHIYQDQKGGVDYQPTAGVSQGTDPATGLPVLWITKANGTKHMRFLDRNGSVLGNTMPSQL